MKRILGLVLGLGLVVGLVWQPVKASLDDDLSRINDQIAELSRAREMSISATKPLEAELSRLREKLANIEAGIEKAKVELRELEQSIEVREAEFATQYVLLAERVVSIYKTSKMPSAFLVLLSSGVGSSQLKDFFYRQVVADRDKDMIAQITADLVQLENDKVRVEEDKARLAELQTQVDKEASFFAGEIAGAKEYQAKLSQQIASLTAKQQQLLAEKFGSLGLPVSLGAGALYCTDDRNLDPGFGGALAFYTYGIPHRVGMNQYGAYGRAKAGQGYQEILRAYFEGITFEKRDNINISVQGHGSMPLETYLLGVYEIPDSWGNEGAYEALKAQVVAARSYALAYTGNGSKEICTSQACQVYKGGNKGGNWERAVQETAGEVMVNGGQVITAWYSSTDGGYTYMSSDVGWSHKPWTKRTRDTSGDVGSFADLQAKAYDRESPCFYAAQGWRGEYSNSAWLKPEEVADIVNVLMLAKRDGSVQQHLPQVDKPNPDGVETWDAERVKSELRARGGLAFNSISGVSVGVDFGLGKTNTVTVSGDRGSESFNGDEFKNFFNLRAPANIQIVGPLYNVEKR